jgi:hypothetical protein
MSFSRTVFFGPIALFWVLAVTIVMGTFIEFLKQPKRLQLVGFHDKWIVIWIAGWWFWALVLIFLFAPWHARHLYRNLFMYIILPLPAILLFSDQMSRVKGFAWCFILTTTANGLLIFIISGVIADPALYVSLMKRGYGAQIWIHNYHRIGAPFGISFIFLYGLILNSRRIISILILIILATFLFLTLYFINSRQLLLATLISMLVFVLWSIFNIDKRKIILLLSICLVMLVGAFLHAGGLKMLIRNDPVYYAEGLLEAWNMRANLWHDGFQVFLRSPLWGEGFQRNSHNIFIGTLSSQGMVGFIYLFGFLWFITLQSWRFWQRRVNQERAVWFMAFQCIFLYGLIHSQFSGSSLSIWHFYWAAAFLWAFVSLDETSVGDRSNSFGKRCRRLLRGALISTTST